MKALDRIATALERIAAALEKGKETPLVSGVLSLNKGGFGLYDRPPMTNVEIGEWVEKGKKKASVGAELREIKEKVSAVETRAVATRAAQNFETGKARLVLAAYVEAFQGRYGKQTRPDMGGRTQGLVKALLKSYSTERLQLLLQAYLQMEDRWFVTKCHDFPTFYENIGKVGVCLDKGKPTTEKTWEDIIDGQGGVQQGNGEAQRPVAQCLPSGEDGADLDDGAEDGRGDVQGGGGSGAALHEGGAARGGLLED